MILGTFVTLHAAVALQPRLYWYRNPHVGIKGHRCSTRQVVLPQTSDESVLEETKIGGIFRKKGSTGRIYIAGLLVAEEENFAFSYNITSLTEPMKRALNRERTNVGRTAYSERVKAMLLQAKSQDIAHILAEELRKLELGTASDEVGWKDVAVHACKILNASNDNVFVTASQLTLHASTVDHAKSDGLNVIVVPDTIYAELAGARDIAGAPIRDLSVYQSQWNDSFKFKWVPPDKLSASEREIFLSKDKLIALVGGLPEQVKDIRISQTMRMDFSTGNDALGLWDPATSSIVVRRDQLRTLYRSQQLCFTRLLMLVQIAAM